MDIAQIPCMAESLMTAWLGANAVDVSAVPLKADWMPDIYIPEMGIIAQCKSSSKYSAIETLVSVSQDNAYSMSGQYLQNLFEAQAKLLADQKEADRQFREFVDQMHSWPDRNMQIVSSVLPFEQLLEIFNQQAKFSYTPPVGMLRFLLDGQRSRNLLRRVFARISKAKKAVWRQTSRFCGLNWSRRLWFLMHGAHPPRTECIPAFGCA